MADSSNHAKKPLTLLYQPLVVVLIAVTAGIVLDRYQPLSLGAWTVAAGVGLTVWLASTWQCRFVVGNFALLAAVGATAGAWHHVQWHLFASNDVSLYARQSPQPACLEASALGPPRRVPPQARDPLQVMPARDCWRFDVEVLALRDGPDWRPASGRATMLVAGGLPAIETGDRLRCFANLSALAEPRNPGEFDRAAYSRSRRVRARLMVESPLGISVIESGPAWTFSRLLQHLRAQGRQLFERYLDPQQAELAAAVLLGLREELDSDRNEAFLTTGTIHILSISGLHVGVLAGALFWIMRRVRRIPRHWSFAVVALATSLYALMVDAEPPVIRSTVLVLIACGALMLGRQAISMNSLAAAALVVLAVNPSHLFQVGAQLSFLCVAVLIWVAARWHDDDPSDRTLDRLVMRNLPWPSRLFHQCTRAMKGVVVASIMVWLVTLPLVMARFHIFSPIAILLNVPLWPLMGLSLLSGFGVLLFGTILPPLAYLCGLLCNASFWMLEGCVRFADWLPGGHVWMPGPADWWHWVFYGSLGLWLALPHRRPSSRWCLGLLAAWALVGIAVAKWPHDRSRLDCTFLNMGHGCAVLMELPSGQTILYDAGQFGTPSGGVRRISECLWSRNITHLDAVVLSHPDIDHYSAVPGLLQKFSVGAVCVSPSMFKKDTYTVRVLRDEIGRRGIPLRVVQAGDCLSVGDGCTVQVLAPPNQEDLAPDNASSVVLLAEFAGRRILLPGDLESYGLDALVSQEPRPCDILLAPHHGSRKSNLPNLSAWCSARYVVFSGDGRWSTPEIEAPYRAVGAQVFHTFADGAIQSQIDADGARVSPFRGHP